MRDTTFNNENVKPILFHQGQRLEQNAKLHTCAVIFPKQTQKIHLKSERLDRRGTYLTLLVCDNIIPALFSRHLRNKGVR